MTWKKALSWLAKLFGWKPSTPVEPPETPEEPSQPDHPIQNTSWGSNAYGDEYWNWPVRPCEMSISGHMLTVKGDCLKIGEQFGMGAEVTWHYKWDGKPRSVVMEGLRVADCSDGVASKDIPAGWDKRNDVPFVHSDAHTLPEKGITWHECESSPRGENLGYSASCVAKKRHNGQKWRTEIIMPE